MRWMVLGLLAVACGGGGGGSADGGGGGACKQSQLCTTVPLAKFQAECGTTAATTMDMGGTMSGVTVSGCEYTGGGAADDTELDCFDGGAATAKVFYDGEHNVTLFGDQTLEDLTGVGDKAFFRFSATLMQGEVYVLKGNQIGQAHFNEAASAAVKQCLINLALATLGG